MRPKRPDAAWLRRTLSVYIAAAAAAAVLFVAAAWILSVLR